MPGLSQLKKFLSDMQSVGNEATRRKVRGQKMPSIPFPEGLSSDSDDSDFDNESIPSTEQNTNDEPLNDLPDLSDFDAPNDLPDLSNFDSPDPVSNASDGVEEKDTPKSLSDDSIDNEENEEARAALLDDIASDIDPGRENPPKDTATEKDLSDDFNLDDMPPNAFDNLGDEGVGGQSNDFDLPDLDDDIKNSEGETPGNPTSSGDNESDTLEGDNSDDIDKSAEGEASEANDSGAQDDFDLPDLDDSSDKAADTSLSSDTPEPDALDLGDLDDSSDNKDEDAANPTTDSNSSDSNDDFDLPNLDDDKAGTGGGAKSTNDTPADNTGANGENFDSLNFEDIPDAGFSVPKTLGDSEDYSNAEIPDSDEEDEEEDDFDQPQQEESAPDTTIEAHSSPDIGADEFSDPTALTNDSGFALEDKDKVKPELGDFEIPGVNTEEVKQEAEELTNKVIDKLNKDLPPNTLSDDDYEQFKKNFAAYPLNIRLAIEDLFLKNEFTDDTEFDIVQKVVVGTPARKIASELEKMLDISLPVPKDFEKRSSAEYDAYKSSFEYQLKNRIIPGAIMCAGAAFICVLLFMAGKNFIYRPLKANSLYGKGYDCIIDQDYKSSDVYFKEAVGYGAQKGWFFKYARAYREHKQYKRAEKMFDNILKVFNNDKAAGLEWARMESEDLADYKKAEEIILRRVLDYHVNDPDALLALADNYLEWATEKDPSHYPDAFLQYTNLLDLYGKDEKARDTYLGRMLRYFIRTDNLQKVLETKARFMTKKRETALSGRDWTELGGFLLDKLYGPLEPKDEYLRAKIEDVRETLARSLRQDPNNPLAFYNMARYYLQMHDSAKTFAYLDKTIETFGKSPVIKKRDMYSYIDAYRLQGELFTDNKEFLKAQESFTKGIALFTKEASESGLVGNEKIGRLYYNMADIDYFISGNLDSALLNYEDAIKNKFDNVFARYKIGVMRYNKNDLTGALTSFMKALEKDGEDESILLAMGNTLSLRGDDYLAQGYYEHLIDALDSQKDQKGVLFPQTNKDDEETMNFYVKSCNNLGVTMHRIAMISGDSNLNAKAIVNLQQSLRAYDALTRNQISMVRLAGSNLAAENIKYITQSNPQFQPAIYTDIPRSMPEDNGLKQ